jgi:hypothetical protein
MRGMDGHEVESLPVDQVIEILKKYNRIKK